MSKKTTETTGAELATKTATGLSPEMAAGAKMLAMTPAEQLKHLEQELGITAGEVEVIAAGSLPFWPAYAGAKLVGTLQSRREVKTKWGTVGLYTVQVSKPTVAATLDGEVFEIQPGDCISLLERKLMEDLQTRVGQSVAVLCMGKKPGKEFEYWDYKIIGKKRTAAELEVASQQARLNLTNAASVPAAE